MGKQTFIILLILLAGITTLLGVTLSFNWTPSPSSVSGYVLFIGTNSGVYYDRISLGNTNATKIVALLNTNRNYYFAVKATNDFTESDFSNEVSVTNFTSSITNRVVKITHYLIYSTNLNSGWQTSAVPVYTFPVAFSNTFFKSLLSIQLQP